MDKAKIKKMATKLDSFASLACVFAIDKGMKAAALDALTGKPFASPKASASLGRQIVDSARMGIMLQPKIDLKKMTVCGFEAFASPDLDEGKISASVFVPSVEMAELQSPFDWLVLEAGFSLAARSKSNAAAPISFNVSPVTLCEKGFAARLVSLARSHGVDLDGVKVEVLEKMPLNARQRGQMIREMDLAKAAGFHFSIDDFGTCDAHCGMLDLPAGEMKIDAFYVRMLSTKPAKKWVASMIDLAKAKGMSICAEGVEHEWQAQALASMGVDVGQGFFWAQSMEAQAALDLRIQPAAADVMAKGMNVSVSGGASDAPMLGCKIAARRFQGGAAKEPTASQSAKPA